MNARPNGLKGVGITVEAQLRTEYRTCPQCRLELTNPFAERCPRCLTIVPVNDPGCGKCVHSAGCPVAHVQSHDTKGGTH